MKRRTVLACGAVGLSALVGCLEEATGADEAGTGSETDDPYDLVQFSVRLSVPDWAHEADASGYIELYGSTEAALAGLDFEAVAEERRDDVESFVEETDFDVEALLYVASEGPSTAYDEIAVEELAIEGGVIVGTATANAAEDGGGGGASHTFPSALVRVAGAGTAPHRAEITVVDGWEDRTELVAEVER